MPKKLKKVILVFSIKKEFTRLINQYENQKKKDFKHAAQAKNYSKQVLAEEPMKKYFTNFFSN